MSNFEKYFSHKAQRIELGGIRKILAATEGVNGMVHLSGGKPLPQTFAVGGSVSVERARTDFSFPSVEVRGKRVSTDGTDLTEDSYSSKSLSSHEPKNMCETRLDADEHLNYHGTSYSKGTDGYLSICKELVIDALNPDLSEEAWKRLDICASTSNTDGLAKCIDLLVDKNHVCFSAEYTFTGIMSTTKTNNRILVPVKMDDQGMIPGSLNDHCRKLQSLNKMYGTNLIPKLLYVIPTGQNPTTVTIPETRRRELYEVCRTWDILIVEDDPYAFLNMDGAVRQKTFLEIDSEFDSPRVIRLDTFSKIIAPGFRLGTVTGPKEFISKYATYTVISNWGVSGVNQAAMEGLLRDMGKRGFQQHIADVSDFYKRRRDALVSVLNKTLDPAKASFHMPSHGMFLWLKVKGVTDTLPLVETLTKEKVSMVPGKAFSPFGGDSDAFRVSFSYATLDEFESAGKKIAKVLNSLDGQDKFVANEFWTDERVSDIAQRYGMKNQEASYTWLWALNAAAISTSIAAALLLLKRS